MFNNLFNRAPAPYQNMDAAEAVTLHARSGCVFVDVREPGEIAATGTVPGAIRAPLAGLVNFALPDGRGALPAVSEGRTIVLVCASGARSGIAAGQLAQLGYGNLHNLRGGFRAWAMAGGPTER